MKRILILAAAALAACARPEPVAQLSIERIDSMPSSPVNYQMVDWYAMARAFDSLAFDMTQTGDYWPLIWIDDSRHNFDQPTFGMYTAMGDARMGPKNNRGEFHESLATMGAVLGGTLVGVDKSSQHGYDFVAMLKNYLNRDNGWNIMLNNTYEGVGMLGGGYQWDFWYDAYPNMLFYSIAGLYPNEEGFEDIMRTIADQFYRADSIMGGNYSIQTFDYGAMAPSKQTLFFQEDAAAAYCWVLYMAWQRFGDERYLQGAKNAMDALQKQTESRFWEILMPYGAYMAARMNAELGTKYEIGKVIDWTFSGKSTNRTGWGVLTGGDGQIALDGLCGSVTEAKGYAFLMNTFEMASPLVPLVRYDQRWAKAVGKWMLNAASNARYCYPDYMPRKKQLLYDQKDVTKGVIAYEGVRMQNKYRAEYPQFNDVGAVALGDGPGWAEGNPQISMFSVYGSAHVGIFGSIIRTTNVEKVLQLDCLATDFFRGDAFPTYLYYNPGGEAAIIDPALGGCDVYDIVSRTFIARNGAQPAIPAGEAAVAVYLPAGSKVVDGKVDGVIVDYL